jgi:hypothetical protein
MTVEDKKITRLCNFPRRHLITGPMLQSAFAMLLQQSHTSLERICCGPMIPPKPHVMEPVGTMSARIRSGVGLAGNFFAGFADVIDSIAAPLKENPFDTAPAGLNVLDFHGRSREDAERILSARKLKFTVTRLKAGARAPRYSSWPLELSAHSPKELVVDTDDRVLAVRDVLPETRGGADRSPPDEPTGRGGRRRNP